MLLLLLFFFLISHLSWASPTRNVMTNSNVVYPFRHLLSKDKIICVVEWFFIDLFMFDMWTVLQGFIAELYSVIRKLDGEIISKFLNYLRIAIVNKQLSVRKKIIKTYQFFLFILHFFIYLTQKCILLNDINVQKIYW